MAFVSAEEKAGRRESVASTIGTHAMEGLVPDPETIAILTRYQEGELSLEEFSEAMDAHARTLTASHSAYAGAA